MAKTYEVIGPYPIVVVRNNERVEISPPDPQRGTPGGTFGEDEIEPGCRMDLNVAAGLVKVTDTPVKAAKDVKP